MNQKPQRDMAGYGRERVQPNWPNKANVAINFVMNFEEGAEYGSLEGDDHAEAALSDIAPAPYEKGQRQVQDLPDLLR